MGKALSPSQKKAAKVFVKNLRDLEKGSGLQRKEFCSLLGLREGTYRDYLTRFSLPNEETQAKIRDAVQKQYARFRTLQEKMFGFLAVTFAPICEAPTS